MVPLRDRRHHADDGGDGVKRALVLATSATSSYSGCRQYRENLADAQAELGPSAPLLHKLRHYFDHPGFVAANADRVRAALTELPPDRREAARLVFTAHSIPVAMNASSGPSGGLYLDEHRETARLVAEAVRGPRAEFDLVWQSRSGPSVCHGCNPILTITCERWPRRKLRRSSSARRASCRTTSRCDGTSTPKHARPPRSLDCPSRERRPLALILRSSPWCGSWWRRSCPERLGDARLAGHLWAQLPSRMLSASGPAFAATSGGGQARVLEPNESEDDTDGEDRKARDDAGYRQRGDQPSATDHSRICTGRGYRRSAPGWVNAARFAIR